MSRITSLSGREILDSRSRPTVLATCTLEGGYSASASVPSGMSTGAAEALELRDGDPQRYRGLGCLKAVGQLNGEIADALRGRVLNDQAHFDQHLIDLDGTENKSRLGANAILAASIAFARAQALSQDMLLYRYFAGLLDLNLAALPRLTINLFSGGMHAGKQVAIQDVLIVPTGVTTIDASLVMMHNIYHAASDIALKRYGMRLLTADEGGLAPPFESSSVALDTAMEAIREAGYEPGVDAHIAVDVAATHFLSDGRYALESQSLDSDAMIDAVAQWVCDYPIVSVEDGLGEDDWDAWPRLCARISDQALVLGDDLLCTNPKRIERAIATKACNALLLKVNQIGTLTEAAQAYRLARSANWHVTLSVRSGDTEDNWAADLAVGWAADQFKNGSIMQSERLAKYNRLLEIEQETSWPIIPWSAS